MAKKSSSTRRTQRDPLYALMAVVGAIVIAIASYLGVDLGDVVDDATPAPPTSPPFVTPRPVEPGQVSPITVGQGFGAASSFWEVYFTAPTGSRDESTYVGGLDTVLAANINALQAGGTLDIAAFEWNNPVIHLSVLAAHERGVTVRMVVDDNHALEVAEDLDDLDPDDLELRDPDAQGRVFSVSGDYRFYEEEYALAEAMMFELIDAGVPVTVDHRSGLMHNKFMIMNRQIVWTGSMNFTVNGVYRNNNNLLMLRSRQAVEAYEAEFNEMFEQSDFGSSRSPVNSARFSLDGVPVTVLFSPEDGVVTDLNNYLSSAESSIRFMAFSFTLDEVRDVLLARGAAGVDVSGIFEVRGSETQFSELTPLFCAGMDVRQDGNPFTFHHKVFIIDERVVLTGSFNFSAAATSDNDENMVIIEDPLLAAQYIAEFDRMMAEAEVPDNLSCN